MFSFHLLPNRYFLDYDYDIAFRLRFCSFFELKPSLGLFELLQLLLLHAGLGQEEDGRCDERDRADDGEDERPAEKVVGVLRHPLVLVAPNCEDHDSDAAA